MMETKRITIAGASQCGKTTLAIALSRAYWRNFRVPTLALDPWKSENNWGGQAWVTEDEQKFFGKWDEETKKFDESGVIWKKEKCLVVVDEASSTIARARYLVPLFTKIRHKGHSLMVICHDATDLLPTMRRNITELFLFCQSPKAIGLWQEDLPMMRGMEQALALRKYQFLWCRNDKQAEAKTLKI